MRRGLLRLILALSSLHVSTTLALQLPAAGQRDARVRVVAYDPVNVVKVNGVMRASTQIVFADDEEIAHVAIGDSVAWEVAPAGSLLFLKPREKHPPTNLQVVTTRPDGRKRSYQFELTIAESSLSEGYFVVGFVYPVDAFERRRLEANAREAAREGAWIEQTFDSGRKKGARNWRFSAQGSIDLEPEAVFDDGKETTFRFAGNRELPAIFLIGSDGSETLAAKDVRGELVTIHATAREFRFRKGNDVLCVFNEAFDPVGLNHPTRTVSDGVLRLPRTSSARPREGARQ
jgi:type IV secretion system protein VirB9